MWGGNFITEVAPTNFHTFARRRMLRPGESAEDFREVTESEKAAMERADAAWTEPDGEFVRQCEAVGAVYNRATGFFELNGLVDITTAQMLEVMLKGVTRYPNPSTIKFTCRTNVLVTNSGAYRKSFWTTPLNLLCNQASSLETVRVSPDNMAVVVAAGVLEGFLYSASKLRRVLGEVDVSKVTGFGRNCMTHTPLLEYIHMSGLKVSVSLPYSVNLSLESIAFMVEKAVNTSPITVELHAEAFARVTDEVLAEAAAKQITIAGA